ncbi:MAG: hypothetical protein ACO3PO_07010 [Limisphaerales bacterium]
MNGGILEGIWLSPRTDTLLAFFRYTKNGKASCFQASQNGIPKNHLSWSE